MVAEVARVRARAVSRPPSGSVLVTVGMPVFNGEEWIGQSVESILTQSCEDFLLIISDNASTDGTRELCEDYERRDGRVIYHRQLENVGVFENYNRVFLRSATKYFKWASSSDICRPRFLERCLEVLEARPEVVLAYPRTALFHDDPAEAEPYDDALDLQDDRPSDRLEKLLARLTLNNVFNGVVRSEALRQTALNRAYASSDVPLMSELVLRGKFAEIPEQLFFRRMNKSTATALKTDAEKSEFFQYEARDVFSLGQWKIEIGLLRGLIRAPISRREKLRTLRLLGRRWRYGRDKLFKELLLVFRR